MTRTRRIQAIVAADKLLDALNADGLGNLVISIGVGAAGLVVYGKKERLRKFLPDKFHGWPVQFEKTSVRPA